MKNLLFAVACAASFSLVQCKKEKEIADVPGGTLPAKFIEIKDSTYLPATLTTTAGTTITFTNNTGNPHKLMSLNPAFFDSTVVDAGKSFSFQRYTDGTLQFYCKEHPNFKGTIIFTP